MQSLMINQWTLLYSFVLACFATRRAPFLMIWLMAMVRLIGAKRLAEAMDSMLRRDGFEGEI